MKQPDEVNEAHQKIQQCLEELPLKNSSPHFRPDLLVIRGHDTRAVIEDSVVNHEVDFLVMGSRGQGSLKRLLLGSVSDHAATHVDCTGVLIVRKQSVQHQHQHHHHGS